MKPKCHSFGYTNVTRFKAIISVSPYRPSRPPTSCEARWYTQCLQAKGRDKAVVQQTAADCPFHVTSVRKRERPFAC